MSRYHQIFQQYVAAVDALRTCFEDHQEALAQAETILQYAFSTEVQTFTWLQQHLAPLASLLLPARFVMRLVVKVADYQVELHIRTDATELMVDCEQAESITDEHIISIPSSAAEAFQIYQETLQKDTELPLTDVFNILSHLTSGKATLYFSLHLFLNKSEVNSRLEADINEHEHPKVISFLFPEALIRHLQTISLEQFAEQFFSSKRRTVIPIFGFSGCFHNDLLVICGPSHGNEFDNYLGPLSDVIIQRTQKVLEFRQAQVIWVSPIPWLTPEMFAFPSYSGDQGDEEKELGRQLKSFQALLAAIFLADYVDYIEEKFRLQYKGFRHVHMAVERTSLLEHEEQLEALYQLYIYVYEGSSADKLEIAQQFLSLIAEDVATLCEKATEIREATKKTYDRALVGKVEDYFEARDKIQERLKTAVAETANSVIGLSREISADIYKIGVSA
jgi:hypothetical protein